MVNSVDFHDFLIWIRLWMAVNETLLPWTCGSFWYGMVTIPICSSYLPTNKDLNIPLYEHIDRKMDSLNCHHFYHQYSFTLHLSPTSKDFSFSRTPRRVARRGVDQRIRCRCRRCPLYHAWPAHSLLFPRVAPLLLSCVPGDIVTLRKGAWVNGKHHCMSLLNHKEKHLAMDIMDINSY